MFVELCGTHLPPAHSVSLLMSITHVTVISIGRSGARYSTNVAPVEQGGTRRCPTSQELYEHNEEELPKLCGCKLALGRAEGSH